MWLRQTVVVIVVWRTHWCKFDLSFSEKSLSLPLVHSDAEITPCKNGKDICTNMHIRQHRYHETVQINKNQSSYRWATDGCYWSAQEVREFSIFKRFHETAALMLKAVSPRSVVIYDNGFCIFPPCLYVHSGVDHGSAVIRICLKCCKILTGAFPTEPEQKNKMLEFLLVK